MSEKVFIDANELFVDSYRLARKIFDDGFRPDYVVGVWRGGCPIGVAVEEFLRAHPASPLLRVHPASPLLRVHPASPLLQSSY